MAYDEGLADRIRKSLGLDALLSERKMFGGLCFMVNGNMAFGIVGEDLMVRVGPERYDEALSRPFAREMDFNGRPMRGFVYVEPEGMTEESELLAGLELGYDFAESMPPKGS